VACPLRQSKRCCGARAELDVIIRLRYKAVLVLLIKGGLRV
jgi:hypothetical protein